MHYYAHHIGDFLQATSNLDDHQLATYMRMVWNYYKTESPLDDDLEGIAFAFRSDEKTVRLILRHYFKLVDGSWHHEGCDKEIAAYKAKSNKARDSANARWRNADALPSDSGRSANARVSDANQEPITNNQDKELKATVHPAAAPSRFDDFWTVYPNKKGRQPAEKKWAKEKLDGMADSIIAHVLLMKSEDDGWRRGYAPMGSTYLNQARWTDVPQSRPIHSGSSFQASEPVRRRNEL